MPNERPQWSSGAYEEAIDAVSDRLARLRAMPRFPRNDIERQREANLNTALATLRHDRAVLDRRGE